MEIRDLISFMTIVQAGSFSSAAKRLGYSQAAITIQIRNLETELGVKLFDRLGRRISLTNTGKVFYDKIVPVMNGLTEASQAVKKAEVLNGILTIGVTDSIGMSLLPDLLKCFHNTFPDVILRIITESIDGLLKMLDQNEIDCAFLVDRKLYGASWNTVFERKEKVSFMAGIRHELAGRKDLIFEEIIGYSFFLTEQDASYRQLLDRELAKRKTVIRPSLEAKSTEFILDMLEDNRGISFMPEYVRKGTGRKEKTVVLDVRDIDISVYIQLLCHKNKWVSGEMRAFFTLVQDKCS